MATKLSHLKLHRGLRLALIGLFIGQGLLKVIMFMMPGTIAYFEALGLPGWLPAFVVTTELFLIVQLGLGMGGFYDTPESSTSGAR